MVQNDDLLNQFFSCVHLAGRLYHRNGAISAIHHGQGKLLHILLTHDGCSQRELAAMMQIRPASVTELIKKAEARGTIRREPNAQDRRLSDVYLTDEGRAQAQTFLHDDDVSGHDIFAVLDPAEKEQLSALLDKLSQHMQSMVSANDRSMLARRHNHNHRECRREHQEP